MFVPPSSPRKGGIFASLDASGLLLQNPGLPPEVWTPKARARMWVHASGACAMIGSVSAIGTWYLAGLHIEGMGGIIAYLAFLMWIGGAVFGLLGGIVAACVTTDEDQKVSLRVIGVNAVLLLLAALFLSFR